MMRPSRRRSRTALFALRPGGITGAIVLANGVYLFRLVAVTTSPLAEVRGDVAQRLSNERFFA